MDALFTPEQAEAIVEAIRIIGRAHVSDWTADSRYASYRRLRVIEYLSNPTPRQLRDAANRPWRDE